MTGGPNIFVESAPLAASAESRMISASSRTRGPRASSRFWGSWASSSGVMRDDGYIRLIGRYKDMLKVGGENVSPMEVEGFLLDTQALELVAIVGHPDERLDEVPVAFVVPSSDCNASPAELEEQIVEACRGKIASFKIPRRAFVLEEMPMTASGKIQKHKLRELAKELLASGA